MIVLGFLMIGIPIAFISPTTGELREQPFIPLFYASIGGIIVVIVYSGYKGCLLYTSPSPRDGLLSRMPSSA